MPSAPSAVAPRTASGSLWAGLDVLVAAEGNVAAQVREVGAEDDTVDSDDIARQAQHQVTPRTLRYPSTGGGMISTAVSKGMAVLSIR